MSHSDFSPVSSLSVTDDEQKSLHDLMRKLTDNLYENPDLLGLPTDPDDAYEWWQCNNMRPELYAVFQSIDKTLFGFYKFLYKTALNGEIEGDNLKTDIKILAENKAPFKPIYGKALSSVGLIVTKDKTQVSIVGDNGVLRALKLLAERVPTNVNKWTPFLLSEFERCAFDGSSEYTISRLDEMGGTNGLLMKLRERCLAEGYTEKLDGLSAQYHNGVGGFNIAYNNKRRCGILYGTLNGIGQKAMLEDFDNLSDRMKQHHTLICKKCDGCLVCTKGGKNKIFTIYVEYGGESYNLCPMFPRNNWETLDEDLMDKLFEYHALQKKYGNTKKMNIS
jgi:hypothetical protein